MMAYVKDTARGFHKEWENIIRHLSKTKLVGYDSADFLPGRTGG